MRLIGYQVILIARDPVGVVISTIFAFGIVPIFGGLYGNFETEVEGVFTRNVVAWQAIGINLAALAFYSIPIGFSAQRDYGILKLFRASPLPRAQLMIAFFVANLLFFLFFVTIVFVSNQIIFGVYFPLTLNSVSLLLLGVLLGSLSMISLGLILPTVLKSTNAVAPLGTLLFIPNLLLSNLTLRTDDLPQVLRILGEALPLTHTGRILDLAWQGGSIVDVNPWAVLILLSYFVVFVVVVAMFLRWD